MVRWYWLKVQYKKIVDSQKEINFKSLDALGKAVSDKKNIVVLCSGPTAKKMTPSRENFYLVTNDAYKLVRDLDFLYYVHDGFFIRRFFANLPMCNNHDKTIFLFRKINKPHHSGFRHFLRNLHVLKGDNYLISDFETVLSHANENHHEFEKFFSDRDIHTKIQNSGIFLLLLGFYLAQTHNKNLKIYGLDLGLGGKVHFEKGGFVGVSITHDRVKVNTKLQLDKMYALMGDKIQNYSNFNANT